MDNNCKSVDSEGLDERTVGDYNPDKNDPLVQHFLNDFATKDVKFERDNGKIFLYSAIGIFTIILVFFVLLSCLIYACLRCKRLCNPYKWHCEKKCQKCCRWLFSILMLLLLPLILYLLAEAIDWTHKCGENEKANEKMHKSLDNSRLKRMEKALITDFNTFYDHAFRTVDDIVLTSLKSANSDFSPDVDSVCGAPSLRQNVTNTIANMQTEIDSLCVEIIMWNDFLRAIIRNTTTLLTQTKEGRAFYRKSNFVKSDYLWLQMSTLFQMDELLRLIDNIVSGIDELYNNFSIQQNDKVKQLLAPYLNDIKEDLDGRGETLRTLFNSLSDDINADGIQLKSGESDENVFKEIPLWVFIFEWLCFVWIILTILILLIALILRCCGKRWRGQRSRSRKRKCCSQECGSCLFQLTVYLMSILFFLSLLPIWWNYEYGVGIYNDRCRKESSKKDRFIRSIDSQEVEAPPIHLSSETADEMFKSLPEKIETLTESFKNVDDSRPVAVTMDADQDAGVEPKNICRNQEVEAFLASNAMKLNKRLTPPNANELIGNLQTKSSNMTSIMKKLKQNARFADETPLKKVCNNFKTQFDLQDFMKFFNETYNFVSNEMKNPERDKELSFCNLNNIKENLIDPFDSHEIPKLINHIGEQCKQIEQYFNESIGKGTERCLTAIENNDKSSKEKLTQALNGTSTNLEEMFTNGLKNYRSTVSDDLGRASTDYTNQHADCIYYTQCKNGIWIPLLLMLLLLLPLIPMAIYLSRLYACCEARPAVGPDCCYESRLYNAIKDRLYKKNTDFERQARRHVMPCPCPPNSLHKQTQMQKQCPPLPECGEKSQLETELAAMNRTVIAEQPQVSKQNDSQQQSCSKNIKLKYKISIRFLPKQKSSESP